MNRNLNEELEADLAALQAGAGLRRTDYTVNHDGSVTRRITSATGELERVEILTGPRWELFTARHALGYSQSQFASLLGVSKRTLENWEQGRSTPSGAAQTLIKISRNEPQAVRAAMRTGGNVIAGNFGRVA